MAAAAEKYARLEKYVYWLLLFTIAVIPLQQEVTAALAAACEELERAGTRIKHIGGSGPDKISVI